jgi:integrase
LRASQRRFYVLAVHLIFYASRGWEDWDVRHQPAIPEGMPILVDDDLRFEDTPASPRPTVAVNQWLRELPASGCPAPRSWAYYARTLRDWLVFLAARGILPFDSRDRLRAGLSAYAEHRASGPVDERLAASTWNQHVSILASFYRWACVEHYAVAEPFTYRTATAVYADQVHMRTVNRAVRRTPKPHVTVKYLERDFADLFLRTLAGLGPGGDDDSFRGRELSRNTAGGHLAMATGMRLQEFSYLLVYEVPMLPARPTELPIPFPVPAAVTKGGKHRTTWISYQALATVWHYIELDRPLAVDGSAWRPDEPLVAAEVDARGGRVNGIRLRWDTLRPADRLRLVAPGGGSALLAVRSTGAPFRDWGTVFERTATRIRRGWEPRFPHVNPHRLRHTFAVQTLERLVGGYYRAAAQIVRGTDADAALALYLSKADPMMVLRDLLGHSSVVTTETYLRRLDLTRVYQEAYDRARPGHDADEIAAAQREVAAEFDEDDA